MPDDTLTGARLVEAGAIGMKRHLKAGRDASLAPEGPWRRFELGQARAALRAQAEAAGVTAAGLRSTAAALLHSDASTADFAASDLLRALAEVLRDE
jgi:hypothetical protein